MLEFVALIQITWALMQTAFDTGSHRLVAKCCLLIGGSGLPRTAYCAVAFRQCTVLIWRRSSFTCYAEHLQSGNWNQSARLGAITDSIEGQPYALMSRHA